MAINQPFLESTPKSSSTRKILSLFLISFAALIIGTTLFAIQYPLKTTPFSTTTTNPISPLQICDQSLDKESCLTMVVEASKEADHDHHDHLLKTFLEKTKPKIQEALDAASDESRRINNPRDRAAVLDCVELLDSSKERLTDSLNTNNTNEDVHTWLSTILTNHVTCLDGLKYEGSSAKTLILEPHLNELILRARTALSILVSTPKKRDAEEPAGGGGFPSWLTEGDRRLLRAPTRE